MTLFGVSRGLLIFLSVGFSHILQKFTEQNHEFLDLVEAFCDHVFDFKEKDEPKGLCRSQYISDKARPPDCNPKFFPVPHTSTGFNETCLHPQFESSLVKSIIYTIISGLRRLLKMREPQHLSWLHSSEEGTSAQ